MDRFLILVKVARTDLRTTFKDACPSLCVQAPIENRSLNDSTMFNFQLLQFCIK